MDEIVDVCDGEGELFLYFSFILFALDLLLGLSFLLRFGSYLFQLVSPILLKYLISERF